MDDKVAFVTGAARGLGRSHAIRLASEGADIIAVDTQESIEGLPYPPSTWSDLQETADAVDALGRRVVVKYADVRDLPALRLVLEEGVDELGHLDIVVANAGIVSYSLASEMPSQMWKDMIDVTLTGSFYTCQASIPHLRDGNRGGSIILTSSTAGLKGFTELAHYVSAKHGVVGLMRTLANELAPFAIRVNTVHPTSVNTLMIHNDSTYRAFRPDLENPTMEDARSAFAALNALDVPWIEPSDVSNAVAFLASDEARYITGVTLPVDAGFMVR
jgi:SDR family mycofactocin-dependent oxidoreductase